MAPRRTGEDNGVVVGAVARDGAAGRAGLHPGDRITAINGERVRDVIDFHFNAGEARLTCAVEREGQTTGLIGECLISADAPAAADTGDQSHANGG